MHSFNSSPVGGRDNTCSNADVVNVAGSEALAASRALEELGHQIAQATIDMYHRDLIDRLQ